MSGKLHISNPFATRFTAPGRLEPLDGAGVPIDLNHMVERFAQCGGMGAIVGPHGSGKSTMLVHLAAALERNGRTTTCIRIRSWRCLTGALAAVVAVGRGGIVCVDSWECLGSVAGVIVKRAAGMWGRGLLVTTHRRCGFPILVRTETNTALLQAIVRRLTVPDGRIGMGDVEDAFVRTAGNLREALFRLYDLFERRTKRGA